MYVPSYLRQFRMYGAEMAHGGKKYIGNAKTSAIVNKCFLFHLSYQVTTTKNQADKEQKRAKEKSSPEQGPADDLK